LISIRTTGAGVLPLCVLTTLFAAGAAAQENAALPEGNAYVRGMLGAPRSQDGAINDYTYDLEETRENLDKDGRLTSHDTRRYEVYFVQTRPVKRLVSKNGIPLSPKEQAEINRKAETQARAISEGRTVNEQPGIRLSAMLDSFEFKTVRREEREGRKTLVFDFEPRKTPGPKRSSDGATDALARILTGRLHVDEADRRVVLLEAHNTPGQKASIATGVKLGALELSMAFAWVEAQVWLPRRVMSVATGRAFLFKTFRVRQTTTYSNYRRFKVDTEERPRS
jgi:hypothetical protein